MVCLRRERARKMKRLSNMQVRIKDARKSLKRSMIVPQREQTFPSSWELFAKRCWNSRPLLTFSKLAEVKWVRKSTSLAKYGATSPCLYFPVLLILLSKNLGPIWPLIYVRKQWYMHVLDFPWGLTGSNKWNIFTSVIVLSPFKRSDSSPMRYPEPEGEIVPVWVQTFVAGRLGETKCLNGNNTMEE
jgi:hypothetical protein